METENSPPVESSTESDTELDGRTPKAVISPKPGIIYLSRVPTGFNVSQTTTFFTEFGRLGNITLRLDLLGFTQGWAGVPAA